MNLGTLLGAIPLLGIVAGLARAKFPRVPFIAAGLVVLAYAAYMAVIAVWAAQCWDCRGLSTTRSDVFFVSAIFFGLLTVMTLLAIWLGARLVTVLQRLLKTWQELQETRRARTEGELGADQR